MLRDPDESGAPLDHVPTKPGGRPLIKAIKRATTIVLVSIAVGAFLPLAALGVVIWLWNSVFQWSTDIQH